LKVIAASLYSMRCLIGSQCSSRRSSVALAEHGFWSTMREPLLPDKTNFSYNLRSRHHDRQFIRKTAHVNDSNFIIRPRMLYSNSY